MNVAPRNPSFSPTRPAGQVSYTTSPFSFPTLAVSQAPAERVELTESWDSSLRVSTPPPSPQPSEAATAQTTKATGLTASNAIQSFHQVHENAGWEVREGITDRDFHICKLYDQNVAVLATADDGSVLQHQGILREVPHSRLGSTLFQIDGSEQVFSGNQVLAMAAPIEREEKEQPSFWKSALQRWGL